MGLLWVLLRYIEIVGALPLKSFFRAGSPAIKAEQPLGWQKTSLTPLGEADQEIREASERVTNFTTMLRKRQGDQRDTWSGKVEAQGITALVNVAQGRKRDDEAVKAGPTLPWSQLASSRSRKARPRASSVA
jgi:hypothetical protein